MTSKSIRLKAIAVAVMAATAFTALAVQAASAAVWTVGTKTFASAETEPLKTATVLMEPPPTTIKLTISGTPVKITAKKFEVVEGLIKQSSASANFTGGLRFSSLTLVEPAGCSPPSQIATSTLTAVLKEIGGAQYLLLQPASGGPVATVTLTGTCSIAGIQGKFATSNFFCGEMEPLGTMAVLEKLSFSPAILSACGGNLSANGSPASLESFPTLEVSSGLSWGAK